MKNIYLIVGPSGVGKTTLVEKLAKEHGMKQVESYTTRKPRYSGETSHIFISDEEFDALRDVVSFTVYDGHRYGVTADIIDTSDLFVVDPRGIMYMQKLYKGRKGIVTIILHAETSEICSRMRKRGDSEAKIEERLRVDAEAFNLSKYPIHVDLMIHSDGIDETAKAVWDYIQFREKHDYDVRIFQINTKHDTQRLCFANAEFLRKHYPGDDGRPLVNLSTYDEVWAGDFKKPVSSLEEVFAIFNADDRPNAKEMRSLSVSDIVEIAHNPNIELNGRWFCDSFGWRKLDGASIIM